MEEGATKGKRRDDALPYFISTAVASERRLLVLSLSTENSNSLRSESNTNSSSEIYGVSYGIGSKSEIIASQRSEVLSTSSGYIQRLQR